MCAVCVMPKRNNKKKKNKTYSLVVPGTLFIYLPPEARKDFGASREEQARVGADAKRLFIAGGGALDSESLTPPGSP